MTRKTRSMAAITLLFCAMIVVVPHEVHANVAGWFGGDSTGCPPPLRDTSQFAEWGYINMPHYWHSRSIVSPDGKHLAFMADPSDGPSFVISLESLDQRLLSGALAR